MAISSLPLLEAWGDFLVSSLWELSSRALRDKIHENVVAWIKLVFLGVFNPRVYLHWASSNSWIIVCFPTPVLLPMAVSAPGLFSGKLWIYLPVSLFNFGGSSFLCELNSLVHLIRVIVFFLLWWYNDFQVPHMPEEAPEISCCLNTQDLIFLVSIPFSSNLFNFLLEFLVLGNPKAYPAWFQTPFMSYFT